MKTNNFGILCLGMMLCLAVVSCGDKDDDNTIELPKVDFVTSDTVEIQVPNEGGHYTVWIDLPDSLHLEENVIIFESFLNYFYASSDGEPLYYERVRSEYSLEGHLLDISVKRLNSFKDCCEEIRLCNTEDEVISVIYLVQKGRALEISSEIPMLGKNAEQMWTGFPFILAKSLANVSVIEQYYCGNKETGRVRYLRPGNMLFSDAWDNFFYWNDRVLQFKDIDAGLLNVYGHYCDVFLAMSYFALVQLWGDVPYMREYKVETVSEDWQRIPQTEILKDLETNLLAAMEKLEEKKNKSFNDANDFFFISKDVVRFVLANIYMFEGNYAEAKPLLETIVSNGFYQLDASTDYNKDESQEIIFGLMQNENDIVRDRSWNSDYVSSPLIPYATLTDVYLSLAECQYHLGNEPGAQDYLQQVMSVKRIDLSETDFLMQLKAVREQLLFYSGNYFLFLKRNGLVEDVCGVEEYRLLFPVPGTYMKEFKEVATQNPGY